MVTQDAAMAAPTTTERRLRFERLVREAEAQVAADPRGYKLRVALLALLGYLVLFGALAVLIALVAGTVWGALASSAFLILLLKKKLIIPLLALIWLILRALWVRLEPPPGYPVTHKEFPAVGEEVEALRKQLRTPPVHRIVITDDFNAGIAQTPRLGVLGWPRNTLIIGLQLMLALTPEQARAVLAHEFGHLSGNHSRFDGWIYRLRLTWYRIMSALDEAQGFSTVALRKFFDWYAPYFNAYSFALARGNEYEADAIAARVTSVQAAAQALVSTHIRSDALHEHYWRPLIRRADTTPEPDARPYTGLAQFLRDNPLRREELLARIRKAIDHKTGHADTHPALKDRLAALDAPPVLPSAPERSAAQTWLGGRLPEVLKHFDQQWLQRNRQPWQQRYQYAQEARSKLTELERKPRTELTQEERWNLAAWTEEFVPDRDALPLYLAYAEQAPEDRDADFAIGRILLGRNDAAGIAHLERATQKFSLALPACEVAYDYFVRAGETRLADAWRRRGERFIDVVDRARAERASLSANDTFLPAALSHEAHSRLAEQLSLFDGVKRAWIAKKKVAHVQEEPLYVIAIEASGWFNNPAKLIDELAQKVHTQDQTYFVATSGDGRAIGKKVAKVGDLLV
jgi:Zn-dependent protease with chaperone function